MSNMSKIKHIILPPAVKKRITNYRFILCISIFLLLASTGKAQEPIWAKAVTGPSSEYGIDADVDSQGNLFIVGYGVGPTMVMDSITYNSNGDGDAFIAKLSASRQLLWFRTLGGNDPVYHDEGLDIHVDNNNDVIVLVKSAGNNFTYNGTTLPGINSPGQYSGEGVILKVDNDGNYLWHDHGSVSSSFQNVVTDADGNVCLTGWFSGSITLGDTVQLKNTTNGTTRDMFVAKYSHSGDLLWAKHVGGVVHNSSAYGHNIAIDSLSNNLVVIGRFNKDIFFNTGMLSTSSSYATFIVAYDSIGTELWKVSAFNGSLSYCQGLDISPNGLIGIAGFNSLGSSPSGLVGFYDLNGAVQSEKIYYSPEYCRLHSLEFNHLDECFITGQFRDSLTIGVAPDTISLTHASSGFLLKLDSNLVPSWANLIPASFDNKVTCKDNRILYSGRIDAPFIYDYGKQIITNHSGDAIFAEIADPSCPIGLGIDSLTTCNSYTWIDGNTYTSSNDTVIFIIPGGAVNGCDSVVTLDLTINKVSDITTSTSGTIITASNTSATYKWLDCHNSYMVIPGEIGQSFTPTANGSYAVQLTENGCVDTSDCVSITTIGIIQNSFGKEIVLYPSPSVGNFFIDLGENYQTITVNVTNLNGRTIQSKTYTDNHLLHLNLEEPPGVYLLMIEAGNKKAAIRLVKM